MKLMTYLNKRGGRILLKDIQAPDKNEWGSAEDAMGEALDLEKKVNEVCWKYFIIFKDFYVSKAFKIENYFLV